MPLETSIINLRKSLPLKDFINLDINMLKIFPILQTNSNVIPTFKNDYEINCEIILKCEKYYFGMKIV